MAGAAPPFCTGPGTVLQRGGLTLPLVAGATECTILIFPGLVLDTPLAYWVATLVVAVFGFLFPLVGVLRTQSRRRVCTRAVLELVYIVLGVFNIYTLLTYAAGPVLAMLLGFTCGQFLVLAYAGRHPAAAANPASLLDNPFAPDKDDEALVLA